MFLTDYFCTFTFNEGAKITLFLFFFMLFIIFPDFLSATSENEQLKPKRFWAD